MAASIMMETLKQIQRDLTDQKEYIRNLHVVHKNINEKYDLMQGNLSDLHKKIDQQQLTIERLEQHIKKNNMLLFGNDDTEINFENKNTLQKSDYYEKEKKNDSQEIITTESVGQFEKRTEYTELNQPENTLKEADTEEIKMNFKQDNINNEQFQENNDKDTGNESTSNYDNNNDEHFQEDNSGVDTGEEFTSNEIREIKELIKEYVATKKTSTEEKPVRKEKVVEISPTFFSEDQISKLNAELERITEMYRSTDIFPIITVVPGPHKEHPIITKLRKGVSYDALDKKAVFSIKLGRDGYKVSEVQELLKEYPDLLLYDVVREMLISKKEWSSLCQKANFVNDLPYRCVQ